MKTSIIPLTPTTIRLFIDIASQHLGSGQIDLSAIDYVDLPTSNTEFEELLLFQATVDTNGIISVQDIFLDIFSDNSANAVSKLQISGDGGTNWIDVTDKIPTGLDIERAGAGLWISSIQTGENKLKIRIVGKSTDGLAATVRVSRDTYMQMIINKKIL